MGGTERYPAKQRKIDVVVSPDDIVEGVNVQDRELRPPLGVPDLRGSGETRILAAVGNISGAAAITVSLIQRDALMKLFESLNGDDWNRKRNWGTGTALGTWAGVTTDEDGNVVDLTLARNNLNGEIPAEVGLLKHLRGVDLAFNSTKTSGGPYRPKSASWRTLRHRCYTITP